MEGLSGGRRVRRTHAPARDAPARRVRAAEPRVHPPNCRGVSSPLRPDWDLFDVDKLDGLAQAEARQKSVEDEIRTKVIRIDRANRIRWPTTPITSPRKERSTRKLRRNL